LWPANLWIKTFLGSGYTVGGSPREVGWRGPGRSKSRGWRVFIEAVSGLFDRGSDLAILMPALYRAQVWTTVFKGPLQSKAGSSPQLSPQ